MAVIFIFINPVIIPEVWLAISFYAVYLIKQNFGVNLLILFKLCFIRCFASLLQVQKGTTLLWWITGRSSWG